MKLINLTLLAFTSISSAFQLPKHQEDGLYSIQITKNGTAIGVPALLKPAIEKSRKGRTEKEKAARAFPNVSIGCNYNVNGNDFGNAAKSFDCYGRWIQPNYAVWYVWGSSIVYMCNYGGWNPCVNQEFWDAMGLVSGACGTDRAGWAIIPDWAKAYGKANSGGQICF